MAISVPLLLEKSAILVHQLDVAGTRTYDPPGESSSGYDEDFREPVVFGNAPTARASARRELAQIRLPCQVEVPSFERLQQMGLGNAPITNIIFVVSRTELRRLGFLNPDGSVPAKKGDRISAVERWTAPGVVTKTFANNGIYVLETRPGSWGFGTDGFDLELLVMADRDLSAPGA